MVTAPPRPSPPKPEDYHRVAKQLSFPAGREAVAVIYLLPRGQHVAAFVTVQSSATRARFNIPRLVAQARRLKATGVVLCHNHPSGVFRASAEDRLATKWLVSACKKARLPVIDHLVWADGHVRSIRGNVGTVADSKPVKAVAKATQPVRKPRKRTKVSSRGTAASTRPPFNLVGRVKF
jgi:DNA repair protein RadC